MTKTLPRSGSDESRLRDLLTGSWAVWKVLFLWQAGRIDADAAAQRLNLSREDADWLRAIALSMK